MHFIFLNDSIFTDFIIAKLFSLHFFFVIFRNSLPNFCFIFVFAFRTSASIHSKQMMSHICAITHLKNVRSDPHSTMNSRCMDGISISHMLSTGSSIKFKAFLFCGYQIILYNRNYRQCPRIECVL